MNSLQPFSHAFFEIRVDLRLNRREKSLFTNEDEHKPAQACGIVLLLSPNENLATLNCVARFNSTELL